MVGKIKFYNETKGFGFITENGSSKEFFVHATGLLGKVQKDDEVQFELEDTKRGLKAIKVKKL